MVYFQVRSFWKPPTTAQSRCSSLLEAFSPRGSMTSHSSALCPTSLAGPSQPLFLDPSHAPNLYIVGYHRTQFLDIPYIAPHPPEELIPISWLQTPSVPCWFSTLYLNLTRNPQTSTPTAYTPSLPERLTTATADLRDPRRIRDSPSLLFPVSVRGRSSGALVAFSSYRAHSF